MSYTPNPIDTSKIALSGDLAALVEQLARNTHDVWAQERLSTGWRYGPRRDDAKREHPSLVPYDELSEQEKDLDRNTAVETIKVLLALGYRIDKPDDDS